jgi:putative membrane protein
MSRHGCGVYAGATVTASVAEWAVRIAKLRGFRFAAAPYIMRANAKGVDMIGFLIRGLVTALGLWVSSATLKGVHSNGALSLIGAGLLLGLVNAIVRPILVILTLPVTIITLGLFLLVVNGLMVLLVSKMMKGFAVESIWWAMLTAVIVTVIGWAANMFIGPHGGFQMFTSGKS